MKLLFVLFALTAHAAKDRDGDGIDDKADACKTAAEDMDGFEDEDGCPELDNDRDGRLDETDECPNEPEDKDQYRDEDGCPEPDNDADGFLDADDQCPNEVGTADGCPDEALDALTSLKNLLHAGDDVSARAIFADTAWDENLVGDSGKSGGELFAEAKEGGWYLRPDVGAVQTVGTDRVVPCDRGIDGSETAWALLVKRDDGWKILGVGSEAEVRALAAK